MAILLGVVVLGCSVTLALAARPAHRRADTATSGCFRYSVRTDRSVYHRGAPVRLLVTATNITAHACLARSCGGLTPGYEVFGASGRSVYLDSGAGVQCVRNPPPPAVIRPGRAERWSDGPWDQRGPFTDRCTPGRCHSTRSRLPPGRYRITWRWLEADSVSTNWFALVR